MLRLLNAECLSLNSPWFYFIFTIKLLLCHTTSKTCCEHPTTRTLFSAGTPPKEAFTQTCEGYPCELGTPGNLLRVLPKLALGTAPLLEIYSGNSFPKNRCSYYPASVSNVEEQMWVLPEKQCEFLRKQLRSIRNTRDSLRTLAPLRLMLRNKRDGCKFSQKPSVTTI